VAQCFQFLPKEEKRVEYCWDQFYSLSHVWLLEKLLYLEYLQQCSVCDRAQYNWMKENPTYAGLAQENGFGAA
jgi:hypothetical protein